MKHLVVTALSCLMCVSVQAQQHCKATTKAKTQCTRTASESGYCKQHDPSTVKCAGTKKDGGKCTLLPKKGSKYCHLHSK